MHFSLRDPFLIRAGFRRKCVPPRSFSACSQVCDEMPKPVGLFVPNADETIMAKMGTTQ